MTVEQERKMQARLEARGWSRHSGVTGSYWLHPALDGKCFSGRIDELLAWLNSGSLEQG